MVFEKLEERIIVQGDIVTMTPLHIGSGKRGNIDIGESDMPIITDTLDQPYIPGSSLKGKVRFEAERIARKAGHNNICFPPSVNNMCGGKIGTTQQQYGGSGNSGDSNNICICCRLFGTAGKTSIASKVKFRDCYPINKVERMLTRAGTALDRKSGSVYRNALYSTDAVPADTKFGFEIVCDNLSEEELKLLRASLKSVQDSSLGGLSSRGFGKIKFNISKVARRSANYYLGLEKDNEVDDSVELETWRREIEDKV